MSVVPAHDDADLAREAHLQDLREQLARAEERADRADERAALAETRLYRWGSVLLVGGLLGGAAVSQVLSWVGL